MLITEGVTRLLAEWSEGDESALEKLTPFIYDEMRRLAAGYLRRERDEHMLQATALVHEAFLRLREMQNFDWQSRAHFIAIAARTMRRILVENARNRKMGKHGGDLINVPLSRAGQIASGEPQTDLIALDEALEKMTEKFPRPAKVVELHFFGGLSFKEVVEVLAANGKEVSLRTVERDWEFARAWLRKEISP